MGKNYDFTGFASELLAQASSLVPQWVPNGRFEGKEWVATNPTRSDSKPGSFKVCTRTGKWSDFAVDAKGGDLISLYAYLRGLKNSEAYKELNGPDASSINYTRNKDNDKPPAFRELVEPIAVPEDAEEMPRPKGKRAKAIYSDPDTGEELYPYTVYKDYKGMPVYRVVTTRNKSTGNKYPIPLSYCRWVRQGQKWDSGLKKYVKTDKIVDTTGWNPKDWPKNIPLCGVNYLMSRPEAKVLVVEGEKAWASIISRFPEYACVTWRGGTNRVDAVDWSSVQGRDVIVCPDYDESGQKAAFKIANILKRQGNNVRICWESLSAGLHEPGWDLADEEDLDVIQKYLKEAVFLSNVEAMLEEEAAVSEDKKPADLLNEYNGLLDTISGEMLDNQRDLRCLGYGADNKCYFICRQRGVIVPLSPSQLGEIGPLTSLMPLKFWYDLFPGPRGALAKDKCQDTLNRWADSKGFFTPDIIRGSGVWVEKDGRHLLHLGKKLLIDGELHDINKFESDYMYEATRDLDVKQVKPLTNEESKKLVEICDWLDWDCPVYGKLLAGWAVIAPMCGGLDWRPHIWVTGTAGSGKTTVISKILHKVCGKFSLFVQGDSSAAGIRQRLRSDALPVIFDEFEGETPKRLDELQKTLDLARQASSESGALMLKGSAFGDAVEFKIRSAFAFSSINVNIKHFADASRITVLTLKDPKVKSLSEKEKQIRIEKYTEYERFLSDTLTPEYINALHIRTFNLLPMIKQNARIFGDAVQKHLGSARFGDQLGILCAAAYSLQHQGLIESSAAEKWVKAQDWTLSTPSGDDRDHDDCLSTMMQKLLRPQDDGHYVERSVGEMIDEVFKQSGKSDEHDGVLRRYGFRVDIYEKVVWIANKHSKLSEIMKDSPYQTWSRLLLRCDGAYPSSNAIKFAGSSSRAVGIPKDVILGDGIDKPEAAF